MYLRYLSTYICFPGMHHLGVYLVVVTSSVDLLYYNYFHTFKRFATAAAVVAITTIVGRKSTLVTEAVLSLLS